MGHVSDPALRCWRHLALRVCPDDCLARERPGRDRRAFPDYRDGDAYRREATNGNAWLRRKVGNSSGPGADSKRGVRPDEEIALAKRMVDAYEAAQSGAGAGSASGVLVDAATVRIFQGVLQRR
jgi:hypothetical protein